jgi:hypothetical protein
MISLKLLSQNYVLAAETFELRKINNIGRLFNSSYINFRGSACSVSIHKQSLQTLRCY